ncbi:hypothetical protein [Niabella aurantiaca]|uniref:hypothetical protein n=1 Tax=Niabella aurantiaca TaxID=379900 RepID=UPI0003615216|nr:hypothetical protein [Niabella aurantiaca]
MKHFLLLMLFLPLMGLAQKKQKGSYYLELTKVEANSTGTIERNDTTTYSWVDNVISIKFRKAYGSVRFILENKSDSTLKVDWNEAVLINTDGNSYKLIHGDTKYFDKEKEQVPTTVYRKSKITEVVAPSDYIIYKSGSWERKEFLAGDRDLAIFSIYNPELINKEVRLVLPILLGNNKIEYAFYFRTIFVNKDDFWKAQKNFF